MAAAKGDMQAQAQPIPHVIMLAFPAQGHIIPAIQLASILTSHGFTVSFVCAQHRIENISKTKGKELNPSIQLIGLEDGVSPEDLIDQGTGNFVRTIQISENMAAAFEQAVYKLITEDLPMQNYVSSQEDMAVVPPVFMIGDFFASWYLDVAQKFNIPSCTYFTSPTIALAVMLYLPRLIEQGIAPVNLEEDREIIIPGLPMIRLCASELPDDWRQSAAKEWREYTFRTLSRLHKASGILVNSFYELESQLIDAASFSLGLNPHKVPVYPIGPILPSGFFTDKAEYFSRNQSALADKEVNQRCQNWLDKQAPSSVLYISFGSIAIPSIRQIQEIAKALDDSHQVFLWSFRLPPTPAAAAAEGAADIVLPEGFLSGCLSYGLIVSTWAPQLLILSHASTGGFLTHCGWNSTLESICSGVPMLPLPQFAEQCLNSKLVTEMLKVGVKVERGGDGVAIYSAMEVAIKELMHGEEGAAMRQRAAALKEKAANAVAYGGSSCTSLHTFFKVASAKQSKGDG